MTTLKSNILLLSVIALAFTGCSDKAATTAQLDTSKNISSSIVGGVLAEQTFQTQNGVVGLIGLSTEVKNIKPDGSIDPKAQFEMSICSGTLIEKNIVLTAAHCVVSLDSSKALVAIAVNFKLNLTYELSTFDLKDSIFAVGVAMNEDFLKGVTETSATDGVSWNDIAIIKLASDAPTSFQFAKLATTADLALIDTKSTPILSGYGVATAIVNKIVINPITKKPEVVAVPEKVPTSGVLRKVENQTVVNLIADAGKDIVFDQSKGTGSCHGDSGGPAFLKQADGSLLQIGVASRGTEQIGNCNEKGIYTNVAAQRPWIDAAIAAILKPTP
jgi:secreted trypsin-like serine protease